jgi:hypothetical protein
VIRSRCGGCSLRRHRPVRLMPVRGRPGSLSWWRPQPRSQGSPTDHRGASRRDRLDEQRWHPADWLDGQPCRVEHHIRAPPSGCFHHCRRRRPARTADARRSHFRPSSTNQVACRLAAESSVVIGRPVSIRLRGQVSAALCHYWIRIRLGAVWRGLVRGGPPSHGGRWNWGIPLTMWIRQWEWWRSRWCRPQSATQLWRLVGP